MRVPLTVEEIHKIIKTMTGVEVDQYLLIEKVLEQVTPDSVSQEEIEQERIRALVLHNVEHKVVGVTFEGRQDALKTIREGDILELEHQPDNPHDKNAVAVKMLDGAQIGFIPKNFAAMVCDIADKMVAKVSSTLGGGNNMSFGLRIKFARRDSPETINLSKIEDSIMILSPEIFKQAKQNLPLFFTHT